MEEKIDKEMLDFKDKIEGSIEYQSLNQNSQFFIDHLLSKLKPVLEDVYKAGEEHGRESTITETYARMAEWSKTILNKSKR